MLTYLAPFADMIQKMENGKWKIKISCLDNHGIALDVAMYGMAMAALKSKYLPLALSTVLRLFTTYPHSAKTCSEKYSETLTTKFWLIRLKDLTRR